jgi:hypothetical protein
MVLQLLAAAAYSWVEGTWNVAVWLGPALLAAFLAMAYRTGSLNLEGFEDTLLNYSRLTVLGVSSVGAAAAVIGFSAKPPVLLLFQLCALTYFGILFWKF